MSVQLPLRAGLLGPSPARPKRSLKGPVIGVLLLSLFLGAGWYYFFGRKPKVAMSIPAPSNGEHAERGLWLVGPKQLLLYANGQVKLVDLADRKEKWSAKMPSQPAGVPEGQEGVNARFVKLQMWADELARKRTALTSPDAIKVFNAEAARYHAELNAARAGVTAPRAVARPAPPSQPVEPGKPVLGEDRSSMDKLRPVVDANVQILEQRIKKRAAKLDAWRKTLDVKKAAAKTDFQKTALKEEEVRYEAELAEQKKDQGGLPQPALAAAPEVAPEPVEEETVDDETMEQFVSLRPEAAACGDWIWLVEGRHAVAFDRASGTVKADVRLSGPAIQVFQGTNTAIVVAEAGAEAEQITKLAASATPQSFYLRTGRREDAFATSEDGLVTPNVQNERTEFSAAGDRLLRADIRLKEKQIKVRDAIKQSSEKELEAAASGSAAHSVDELKAISALIANDAARLTGDGKERLDESTYEITLRRPFDQGVGDWSGVLKGRVQIFSTPTLDLVTAGTKLLAFDRANKKLWEATLGAPVPIGRSDEWSEHMPPPWLESGEKLFFADGAFLTAFQATTGQVLWRLPSVGIRKLQIDSDGNLYVLSDNLHVETLTYTLDESLRDTEPLTIKIKPDGKIAWQVEKYQDLWVSGKDVYVFRETKNGGDLEAQVFDRSKAIEARVKIYKLGRGKGSPMWEWFQARRPLAVEAEHKHVALLFGDELQIIHSICW